MRRHNLWIAGIFSFGRTIPTTHNSMGIHQAIVFNGFDPYLYIYAGYVEGNFHTFDGSSGVANSKMPKPTPAKPPVQNFEPTNFTEIQPTPLIHLFSSRSLSALSNHQAQLPDLPDPRITGLNDIYIRKPTGPDTASEKELQCLNDGVYELEYAPQKDLICITMRHVRLCVMVM